MMRTRVLRILATVALMGVALGAVAFDWGGTLDNTTGVQAPAAGVEQPDLIQRTAVSLWMTQPLGAFDFRLQGSYVYTPAIPVLADVDALSLTGRIISPEQGPAAVDVALGRLGFSDATGVVLNHTLDGLRLRLNWRSATTTLGVGTTALILKPTSGIVLSDADAEDRASSDWPFTTPRLIAQAELALIGLLADQTVTIGALVQEDLRPEDSLTAPGTEAPVDGTGDLVADPTAVGRTDTQYATLKIDGPVAQNLFHRTYYTLNTGRAFSALPDSDSGTGYSFDYAPILAHMAGAQLSYFLPALLNSRVRLSGLYTTGDADLQSVFGKNTTDNYTAFLPLTPSSFSEQNSLQPGNSAHAAISYNIRPLLPLGITWVQTNVGAVAYFRTAGTGPVSLAAVDKTTEGSYIGSGIDLSVSARPFSDLRVVLASGFFFPNADVMAPGNENVDYKVTLQGVLRF